MRPIEATDFDASIVVAGAELRDVISYELNGDMLEPAATFTFRLPLSRAAWNQVKPDLPVKIFIDGVHRLTGLIGKREVPEGDDVIEVTGRNLVGRLTQDAAPTINYADLGFLDLIKKLAEPWFTKVTSDNTRNRKLTRGRGKKAAAKASTQALTFNSNKKWGTRIEPGQTRWEVIEQLCGQASVLCWSAGDGRELIVGRPHEEQEIQFRFFMPEADSPRASEATVLSMGVADSVEDLYSQVICVGSGQGTDDNYGAQVASRYGDANDGDGPGGIGDLFTLPKRLLVQRPVNSIREAMEIAEVELFRRYATTDVVTVTVAGHGQRIAGAYDTLFDFDLLASVEHEPTGKAGVYMITSYSMTGSRDQGQKTTLRMVPRGTELSG